MRTLIAYILLACLSMSTLYSQELKCNIQINTQQVQGTNKKVYQTLQTALYEFLNNRAWTNHTYTVNERIDCSIVINIQQQVSADEFSGTLQVQSRRPVFNSSYNTTMLNYIDNNFSFKYVEFEAIELNENTHKSNLTSVLAFYAYIILGLDYDSFSLEGGSEYFTKAEKLVNNAQNSPDKGWKAFEAKNNKNRYWLVKNILDKRYSPIREFSYKYHRLGLDLMSTKPNEARTEISEDLILLQKVFREKPDPFLHYYHVLFDAKSDEFINVFSEAMPDEKNRVFNILNEIDNANATKYKKLKE
jgi:hypothetical protein